MVSKADIEKYLEKNSDFAFEMMVKKTLGHFGSSVTYSGTYVDPVTNKQRQYDFQIRLEFAEFVIIACIEAKNIKSDKPLIVQRTARLSAEAFYDVIACQGGSQGTSYHGPTIKRVTDKTRLLEAGAYVGRSFDQFGGQAKEDPLYDKFSQPTNCIGAICRSDRLLFKKSQKMIAMIPILVVPDESLWVVDYDNLGTVASGPTPASASTFFIGSTWECVDRLKFTVSHVFIATVSSLVELIENAAKEIPEGLSFKYLDGVSYSNNNGYV